MGFDRRVLLAYPAFVLSVLVLTGCAVTRRVAVDSVTPILESTLEATFRDPDLDTVREGVPANLLLLRGMAEEYPEREDLRVLVGQAYFSFSMGFVEDIEPDRATLLYKEGWRLGREYLLTVDWFQKAEAEKPLPEAETLEAISEDDVPVLFWTLANWMRWVSLNLDDPAAVAMIPRIELYLSRIIELRGDYYEGLPYAMLASIQGFRPQMLGGKPEESKRNFQEAFRISGNRMLLFQVLYAQFYCRQVLDEECFDSTLNEVLAAPDDLFPDFRLWNEVAKDKARYLLEIRDELF
ncbi:MAG: TRAP transporter TatT component family protein [Candidatus Eisenbacteria bacterium]